MKTNRLLAMSMALCFGATSAFAQAPANDDCGGAISLTPGTIADACTAGTNVDATAATDEPSAACWASDPDHTVWYKFLTDANGGDYTITTDVASGDGNDTQLQLFHSTNGTCDTLTSVSCDEDGGLCTGLASEINASGLDANTWYFIQVDIFDDVQGDFNIQVIDEDQGLTASSNDCIYHAENITADINSISASNPFSHHVYDYFGVTEDIIKVDGSNYAGCNTPVTAAGANETYYGVWFDFTVDANTKDTWISVYGVDYDKCDNGSSEGIFYTMHLFSFDTTNFNCTDEINVSTDTLGCSIGDGLGSNGNPEEDKACGSFFDHPRLNIADLPNGTYQVMVAQMTRVNTVPGTCYQYFFDPLTGEQDSLAYPCDVEEIAEPSNGRFELLIEAAPSGNTSIDGVSADNCANAADVTNASHSGLTNAGLIGNLWTANSGTCKTSAAAQEPMQYDYAASGHGYNNEHCDSTSLTIPVGASAYNNNSAVYSFEVVEPGIDGGVICFHKDSLKEDILSDFDLLCDTALVIYPGAFPSVFDPLTGDTIINIGEILEDQFGPEIVIPDDATCEEIRTVLEMVLTTVFGLLPTDEVCVPLNCSPNVNISLCNLTMCGNEDNGAAVWVTSGDCVNGAEVMFAPIDNGTTALTLNTALEPLSPGTYYIVVDGSGAALGYDLTVDVNFRLGLGGADCDPTLPQQRSVMANINNAVIDNVSVSPNPASNELNVNFNADNEVNSVYIRVVDMTGKVVIPSYQVSASSGANAHTVDVSGLSSGLYMISIEKDGETTMLRFSKN